MVPIMTAGGRGKRGVLAEFRERARGEGTSRLLQREAVCCPPVIFDSAGAAAQAFAAEYERVTGSSPGWIGARAYDAARLMVEALRRARFKTGRRPSRLTASASVPNSARSISPQTAVTGFTGSLYFDANRDMPRPFRVGFFRLGRFITAPLQLVWLRTQTRSTSMRTVRRAKSSRSEPGTTGCSGWFTPGSTSIA